ncbi:MAG: hypothetical protein FWD28_01130 [Treponema sp.]|nr:hypothetical protein [Treponema sp.]
MIKIGNNKNINTLEKAVEKLGDINTTLEGILSILRKPDNKVMTVLKFVGAVVGALSFVGIVEVVRQWIIGG